MHAPPRVQAAPPALLRALPLHFCGAARRLHRARPAPAMQPRVRRVSWAVVSGAGSAKVKAAAGWLGALQRVRVARAMPPAGPSNQRNAAPRQPRLRVDRANTHRSAPGQPAAAIPCPRSRGNLSALHAAALAREDTWCTSRPRTQQRNVPGHTARTLLNGATDIFLARTACFASQ